MRKIAIAFVLCSVAATGSSPKLEYQGTWQTNYNTFGPANVSITGHGVSLYIKNAYTGIGYQVTGQIVDKVFTGTMSSNGKVYFCSGTGTYGAHVLKFSLNSNSTGFVVNAFK